MNKKPERPKLRLVHSRKTESAGSEKKAQPVEGGSETIDSALENQEKKSRPAGQRSKLPR